MLKVLSVAGGFCFLSILAAIVGGVIMLQCEHLKAVQLWEKEARNIPWFKPWEKTINNDTLDESTRWFVGGELNASYACLDVHLNSGRGEHRALVWESERGETQTFTYAQLCDEVNRMAYVLQRAGVTCGDVVIVYLPMIPEAIIALLACARLGAIHAVVFSGFGAHALKSRIEDTGARYVITAESATRRGKTIPLKALVDEALRDNTSVKHVLLVRRADAGVQNTVGSDQKTQAGSTVGTNQATPMTIALTSSGSAQTQDSVNSKIAFEARGTQNIGQIRDIFYDEVRPTEPVAVDPVHVESNHPLFILYTSGTTGKPKGIVHSTGGYLTYAFSTFKQAFEPRPDDIYWCTADIGWITGHSYVVYAPLMHGLTVFVHEGTPDWPDAGIWWRLIEKHRVSIFYTSPTAVRMAMKAGSEWCDRYDLSSLRLLGSVGEPINPEAWQWFYTHIGRSHCPIIDTWWQTETGGFMIAPTPQTKPLKPGSATKPLLGIDADVVDEDGCPVLPGKKGFLVIRQPWPGMAIGIYGAPGRFAETYLSKFPPTVFYTGDYAYRDKDGYFWIVGRADEVIKTAGHRAGTVEIESAALMQKSVAEAAAIGASDPVKGEHIVLFTTLKNGAVPSDALTRDIIATVRTEIGAFVTPSAVYYVKNIPKTRSGKIMRRLLKSVVEGTSIGDTTTLEDGASFEELRTHYEAIKHEIGTKQV